MVQNARGLTPLAYAKMDKHCAMMKYLKDATDWSMVGLMRI
jgi:hypothetical protein